MAAILALEHSVFGMVDYPIENLFFVGIIVGVWLWTKIRDGRFGLQRRFSLFAPILALGDNHYCEGLPSNRPKFYHPTHTRQIALSRFRGTSLP